MTTTTLQQLWYQSAPFLVDTGLRALQFVHINDAMLKNEKCRPLGPGECNPTAITGRVLPVHEIYKLKVKDINEMICKPLMWQTSLRQNESRLKPWA